MYIVYLKNYDNVDAKIIAGNYTMQEGYVSWPCASLEDAKYIAANLSAARGKANFMIYEIKEVAEVQAKQITAKTKEYNERGEYFPGADINV